MSKTYNGRFSSPPEPPSGSKWIVGGCIAIPLWSIPVVGQIIMVGSICCFVKGGKMNSERKMYHRFHEMCAVIGKRSRVPVRELAKLAEMGKGEMRKYLQKMIAKGYFGSEACLDVTRDELVLPINGQVQEPNNWRDLASEMMGVIRNKAEEGHVQDINDWRDLAGELKDVLRKKMQPQEPQPKPAKAQEETPKPEEKPASKKKTYMDELEKTLSELYQLNEQIADEAVSQRIDRIGTLTASIFRVVIEKPERVQDVRKFMNYYLPTTLKLLKSYDMLEDQSYQGENIIASRKKIENVLDMLIEAYEKQLDKLFTNDALDIATDIDVLETMMAGDGLSSKGQIKLTL